MRKYLIALLAAFILPAANAADVMISALPSGTTLAGTETIPAVQSAATVKITATQLSTWTLGTPLTSAVILGKFSGTCSSVTLLHGGGACGAVVLTTDVSGRLPYANLAQGSALSVTGVTGNATADVASIAAATDGNVLRRSGTTLAFGTLDLTAAGTVGTSILGAANGGTGNAFTLFSGPSGTVKTFTLPNATATILTSSTAVTVGQGGTGLTSGTSGGVPYFNSGSTMGSSGALASNVLVTGGGAGAAPATSTAAAITGVLKLTAGVPAAASLGVDVAGAATANMTATGNVTCGAYTKANAASGAIVATLPAASACALVHIKKTDATANLVTVTPASGTIDGGATAVLNAQWAALTLSSDGTNWFIY